MVGREGGAASPGPSQTCPSRWGCGGMGGGERRRMPKRRTVPASIPPPAPSSSCSQLGQPLRHREVPAQGGGQAGLRGHPGSHPVG